MTHTNQTTVTVNDVMTSTLDPALYDALRNLGEFKAGESKSYPVDVCTDAIYETANGQIVDYTIHNIASIVEDPTKNDEQDVTVRCIPSGLVFIQKSANSIVDEYFTWEITKTVVPQSQDHYLGEPGDVTWTVEVTRTSEGWSRHRIYGDVTIVNQGPGAVYVTDIKDVTDQGESIALACTVRDSDPLASFTSGVLAVDVILDCSYGLYDGIEVSPDTTENVVTVTTQVGGPYSGAIPVSFENPTVIPFNDTMELHDPTLPELEGIVVLDQNNHYEGSVTENFQNICQQQEGPFTFGDLNEDDWSDYFRTGERTNTAWLEEVAIQSFNLAAVQDVSALSATAVAEVNCWIIDVDKTAESYWQKDWTWEITKVASTDSISVTYPTTATIGYTVTVIPSSETNYKVSGTVTINNPAPLTATVSTEDLIHVGDSTMGVDWVNCSVAVTETENGFTVNVAPESTLTCSYQALPQELLIGAQNQFTVTQSIKPEGSTVYTASADIVFSETENLETGLPITVTDVMSRSGVLFDTIVTPNIGDNGEPEPTNINYDVVVCGDNDYGQDDTVSYILNNRATINETGQSATESVAVQCQKYIDVQVTAFCRNDAPWLSWNIVAPGFSSVRLDFLDILDSLPIANPLGGNYEFSIPLEGERLWPGAGVDAEGNGNQWPGWSQNPDGTWTDNGSPLRLVRNPGEPGRVLVRFHANPEQVVEIVYPPSDPTCNTSPPEVREVVDSSLGNYVWHDVNKDGIQDAGEPGIGNIIVELYRVDVPSATGGATKIGDTKTNDQGIYGFTGLDAGTYYLQFIMPNGVLISLQDANENSRDTEDSDIDPETGRTVDIVLPVDTDDLTWDAGLYYAPTDDPDDPNGEPQGGSKYWLPIIGAGQ